MITNHDRSGWFGASDTTYVIGNRQTTSFKKWWLEKLGMRQSELSSKAMMAGNAYEHKILDTIPGVRKDHQILIPKLRLRVNLDGDRDGVIYEVKTYQNEKSFQVNKQYWRQAQVEMFAMKTKSLYIVSYGLEAADYKNYFREIDLQRLKVTPVEYDEEFINHEYLPALRELCRYLKKGGMPQ